MEGALKMTCSDRSAGHIYKIHITHHLNGTSYSITYKFEVEKYWQSLQFCFCVVWQNYSKKGNPLCELSVQTLLGSLRVEYLSMNTVGWTLLRAKHSSNFKQTDTPYSFTNDCFHWFSLIGGRGECIGKLKNWALFKTSYTYCQAHIIFF